MTLGELLVDNGFLQDGPLTGLGVKTLLALTRPGIKHGEYRIPPGASLGDIITIISSGVPHQRFITLPEGFTRIHLSRVLQSLVDEGLIQPPCTPLPPEGHILPETYAFSRGMACSTLVASMADASARQITTVWEARDTDLPLRTPEDLLTLASIVEKETHLPHERPLVASVFINRLRRGMPLQADPTVVYGITGGDPTITHHLTRGDLSASIEDNPYTTYTTPGLPPGPIASPGLDALRATANPATTAYLYFVADGSGGHTFSTNLKEHQRSHGRWRRLKAARKNQHPASSTKAQAREKHHP